jgi:oligosaccharide reducing-end xylanase
MILQRLPLLTLLGLLAFTPLGAVAPALADRNLFSELLGKSETEVDQRIAAAWQQLFYGDDATERVYYPVGSDQAYIADIGNSDVRSEGMSYGMMIAVQLGHREEFDRLWRWAQTHMQHQEGPRRGYFAWQCTFDGRMIDPGSASDGEIWFTMALLFADHRWGSEDIDYAGAAQTLLREMRLKPATEEVTAIFDVARRQVVFAPTPEASGFTDPSYHLPSFFELWALWDQDPEGRVFWAECAAESRRFFRRAAHPETGLMPEYAHFDGAPYFETTFGAGKGDFRFDAWRTLANVAMDHHWFRADPWQVKQSNRALRFLASQGQPLPNQFTLDGRPLTDDPSIGLVAMAAVAGLAADPDLARPFVEQLWNAPIAKGQWRYYNGLLQMLALLQASGRFTIHAP